LGYTRLSKFSKLRASISIMDFTESANQMYDSKWRTQVPNRAERLINRMKALGA